MKKKNRNFLKNLIFNKIILIIYCLKFNKNLRKIDFESKIFHNNFQEKNEKFLKPMIKI